MTAHAKAPSMSQHLCQWNNPQKNLRTIIPPQEYGTPYTTMDRVCRIIEHSKQYQIGKSSFYLVLEFVLSLWDRSYHHQGMFENNTHNSLYILWAPTWSLRCLLYTSDAADE